MSGILYLVPNTLDTLILGDQNKNSSTLLTVLPSHVIEIASQLKYFLSENPKSTRAFLNHIKNHIGLKHSLQTIQINEFNIHTPENKIEVLLEPIVKGEDGGLISEAGCPAIADPGALLIRYAHQKKLRVIPLVGPSSILLALMASGLNGQNFAFHGYLPKNEAELGKHLRFLEQQSQQTQQTQIFIEVPHRNQKLFDALIKYCQPNTLLCIATDLTLFSEEIKTRSISDWKKMNPKNLDKRPTLFLFLGFKK